MRRVFFDLPPLRTLTAVTYLFFLFPISVTNTTSFPIQSSLSADSSCLQIAFTSASLANDSQYEYFLPRSLTVSTIPLNSEVWTGIAARIVAVARLPICLSARWGYLAEGCLFSFVATA